MLRYVIALFVAAHCCSCTPRTFSIASFPGPVQEGEGLRLTRSQEGTLLASWIEPENDTVWKLQYAKLESERWSVPQKIAEGGREWFVNWADTPQMGQYSGPDGPLLASWLVKSDRRNPYNHHILLSHSDPDGQNWQPPFHPHPTGVPAFFGLHRFVPLSDTSMLMIWMDGRTTQVRDPRSGRLFPNPDGGLYLHAAEIHPSGLVSNETVLDSTISQLCPFDAVRTADGVLLAYRDHQSGNVKDIAVKAYHRGQWHPSRLLHPDGWQFSHLSMEGPALAAQERQVVVAWFSSPNDTARVQLAFSPDGGQTFGPPVRVDEGRPVGKVDVEWTARGHALVSWVENQEDAGRLMLAEVAPSGQIRRKVSVAPIPTAPTFGFPVLATNDKNVFLFWKQEDQSFTGVQVKR